MRVGRMKALLLALITGAALVAAGCPAVAVEDRPEEGMFLLAEPYQAPPGPKVPEAERLYRAGKGFEAIDLLKGVVAREPSNAPAWVQLVELELEAGEIKEAWNHARRAAEACPDDSRVWAMKAIARGYKAILSLHHLNFFGLAGVRDVIHSFDRAIELNHLDVRSRLMRFEVASSGRLLSGVGPDDLEEEAAQLEAIDPAAAAYARAMMLGWEDEDEEAARLLDDLVRRRPADPKAWLAHARQLMDWGLDEPERAREAVESLRKAEELGMGSAAAFERCRVISRAKLGKPEEREKAWLDYIRSLPDDDAPARARATEMLGHLHRSMGREEEGLAELKRALELNPLDWGLRRVVGKLEKEGSRLDDGAASGQ